MAEVETPSAASEGGETPKDGVFEGTPVANVVTPAALEGGESLEPSTEGSLPTLPETPSAAAE